MSFLTHIKMLALDVDGVMTDGIIYYSPSGDAMKGFSARDGMGISLIRAAGLKTALVTGRRSPMVEQRAKDLHIDYVLQDCSRKLLAMPVSVQRPSMPAKKPGGRPLSFRPIPAATGPCGNLPNIS